MPAFVEILSGCIRIGPDASGWLDPYLHSIAFSSVDGVTAVLKGLSRPVSHRDRKDIQAALAKHGLRLARKFHRAKCPPRGPPHSRPKPAPT